MQILGKQLFISYSFVPNILSKRYPLKNLKIKKKKDKNYQIRSTIYNLYATKKMLEREERRTDAIHILDGRIERKNKIQEKRRNISERLIF